jgi:hypothetical protein
MGYEPNHKRIRERYNPTPTEREKRHHLRVMDLPCLVCLATPCGVFHHLLQNCAGKRWRRDHEFGVPLCDPCHRGLHANGSEIAWQGSFGLDLAQEAEFLRLESVNEGIL